VSGALPIFASVPPQSLSGLIASLAAHDGVFVYWDMKCACGSDSLGLECGIETGEFTCVDPVVAQCSACGSQTPFFDSNVHGYDGVLNGGACYEQSETRHMLSCASGHFDAFNLKVGYSYNFEEGELTEIVNKNGHNASDYFDSISISVSCKLCSEEIHVGDWELA
jgi:hypothetical protein